MLTTQLHSIETLGALDGPGLRTVAFLQGCPLRCAYCHNPDTWGTSGGTGPSGGIAITAAELVAKAARYKLYYGPSGGLTLSGGEPLLHGDFCAEVINLCHAASIHCAIDTSGAILHKPAVDAADLIILDVKHTDPAKYKELTGGDFERVMEFLDYCKETEKPLWIRQVIIPGINDTKADMLALKSLLNGANVQKTELLPYHTLGAGKWAALGMDYPLKGVQPPSETQMNALNEILA